MRGDTCELEDRGGGGGMGMGIGRGARKWRERGREGLRELGKKGMHIRLNREGALWERAEKERAEYDQ